MRRSKSYVHIVVIVVLGGAALAGLAACATSASQIAPGSTAISHVSSEATGAGNSVYITHDIVKPEVINASFDRVWNMLPDVYRSFGLELTQYDTATHMIGGQRLRSRKEFLGKPLDELLDCSETAGIPNTFRYDMNITLVTQITKVADGTSVITRIDATAKPSGTMGDPVQCAPRPPAPKIVAQTLLELANKK